MNPILSPPPQPWSFLFSLVPGGGDIALNVAHWYHLPFTLTVVQGIDNLCLENTVQTCTGL